MLILVQETKYLIDVPTLWWQMIDDEISFDLNNIGRSCAVRLYKQLARGETFLFVNPFVRSLHPFRYEVLLHCIHRSRSCIYCGRTVDQCQCLRLHQVRT
jgi:hypothetical protein